MSNAMRYATVKASDSVGSGPRNSTGLEPGERTMSMLAPTIYCPPPQVEQCVGTARREERAA